MDGLGGCHIQVGEDIHFRDARLDAVLEILDRQAGAPVKYQRRLHHLGDLPQPGEVQLGGGAVGPVGRADGHRQGVYPGAAAEFHRLLGLGEHAVVPAAGVGAHVAQLRLYGDAPGVGLFDQLGHGPAVAFKIQGGAVVHHRAEAQVHGLVDFLQGEAVVEVEHHRHSGLLRHGQEEGSQLLEGGVGQQNLRRADDHRGAQLLGGGQHALGHLQIHGIEQPHRVVLSLCPGQDFM